MKTLTASIDSQGLRDDDFAFCVPGELVWIPEPCHAAARGSDDGCGCLRAFNGLASHGSTTTAVVQDVPGLTPALLIEVVALGLRAQGFPDAWADLDARELMSIAAHLDEGDIVERYGDTVGRRFSPVDGALLDPLPRAADVRVSRARGVRCPGRTPRASAARDARRGRRDASRTRPRPA